MRTLLIALLTFVKVSAMAQDVFEISKEQFAKEASKKLNGDSKFNVDYSPLPTLIKDSESMNRLGMLLRDNSKLKTYGKFGGCSFKRFDLNGSNIMVVSLNIEKTQTQRVILYISSSGSPYLLVDDFSNVDPNLTSRIYKVSINGSSINYLGMNGEDLFSRQVAK